MNISNTDFQRLHAFYLEHLQQYEPEDNRAVSWTSKYHQLLRFKILSEIGNIDGASVLDVGCGTGEMYAYLKENFPNVKYKGVDIVPEMIEACRKRFPEGDFEVMDITKENPGKFDYVFASGTFSFKVENYKEVYFGMVRRMFEMARKGIAFNMLDVWVHGEDEEFSAYTPSEVWDFAKTLTEKLAMRQDYIDYDFTLYLYKEEENKTNE